MDERTITLLLRLVHILAGIFWVGAIFLIAGFLLPTMRGTGPAGGRFMQHLMQQRKLPMFLAIATIGQSAAQAGGPSAEQQAEIERLQGRMVLGSRLVAGFLAVASAAMAIARYL